jgi:phosphatidylserine/phosphatidylglycerophosphate/cardiolipin synthase-like enzyme
MPDVSPEAGCAGRARIGLREARCQFMLFRPKRAPFARTHRKVAVIDGRVGFTGGFGVDDGPCVSDMQEAFAEDWQESRERSMERLPPSALPGEPISTSGRPRRCAPRDR